jgi:hypothetical protein
VAAMETTTSPIVRPATAGRVSVTFPGSLGYDTATVEAVVVDQDDRSMDLLAGGVDLFTIYDVEQADPALTITVLS